MLNNEQQMLNVEVVYFNIQNSKLNIPSLEMLNDEQRMLNVEVFIKNKTPVISRSFNHQSKNEPFARLFALKNILS